MAERIAVHAEPVGEGFSVRVDLEAAAEMLWNLHTQTRPWSELNEVEQDEMRYDARAVVMAALGVEEVEGG